MKRTFSITALASLLSLMLIAQAAQSRQKAETQNANAPSFSMPSTVQILDKYIRVIGRKEGIEKLTNRVMKGSLIAPGGTAPLEIYEKSPNKFLVIINSPVSGISRYFEDYRAVDGIKLPFTIRRSRPYFSFTYKFDEIKHDISVDDAMFKKPAT